MNFDPMIPIWLQVATSLKREIVTGRIPPGGKLPGGRDLALQYGINPNTAARIYQELEREGLCATRRGMGTYVTEDTERIQRLRTEMARAAMDRFLSDLRGLGLSGAEAVQLLETEVQNHAEE